MSRRRQGLRNFLQSVLVLAGLAAMLAYSAKWLVGLGGVLFVSAGCGLGILTAPRLSSNKIMH